MALETTRLSSKGQVIIPKAFRDAHHWTAGLELIAIDTGDGILLKPRAPFADTSLAQVAGCLHHEGHPALSQDDIDAALQAGFTAQWHGRD